MIIQKIPEQIIKSPLIPLNLKKVDSIALHHMAHPTAGIKDVEKWHIDKGWRALGYNFWVAFDGTIYEGRGFNLGAGVDSQNDHIISIGFQGDYHNTSAKMPDEQFNSGIDVINYVTKHVPTARFVAGHREFMSTACPGDYFPVEEMTTLKKRGELSMAQYDELKEEIEKLKEEIKTLQPVYYDWTEACPKWSIPYVQKALDMGFIKGDEQGRLRLTDTKIYALVLDLRDEGIMD